MESEHKLTLVKKFIRQHDVVKKLLFTLFYLTLLGVLAYFDVQCIFLTFLKIPCPGCGMSRAVVSALKLDFAAAFEYHLMFWSMPLLYVYFITDGKLFKGKYTDRIILWCILAGFVINWVLLLIKHF